MSEKTYFIKLPSGNKLSMTWADLNYCAQYFQYINLFDYIHDNHPELSQKDLDSITVETMHILEKMEDESKNEDFAIHEAFIRKGLDY